MCWVWVVVVMKFLICFLILLVLSVLGLNGLIGVCIVEGVISLGLYV